MIYADAHSGSRPESISMSMRKAFIAAIANAPDDETPRLVFADWLEDNGDPERAEFIRLQCRLAAMDHFAPESKSAEFEKPGLELLRISAAGQQSENVLPARQTRF